MKDPRIDTALKMYGEGTGFVLIGREVGAGIGTIEGWVRTYLYSTCKGCGTKLRRATSEGRCGLCIAEAEHRAKAAA